jgi:HEPN domain-containing protein
MSKQMADEWLLSAAADMKSIGYIIDDDFLTHFAVFHAQQAVDKCFKAILEFQSKRIPKEHSTLKLYGLVIETNKIEVDTSLLTDMDDMYIESRYPGDLGLLPDGKPTTDEAREYYELSKKIYNQVREIINS